MTDVKSLDTGFKLCMLNSECTQGQTDKQIHRYLQFTSPFPKSSLRLPLALFYSHSLYRRHTPQHCFYFRYSPLLPSQSPCIDTLYRWLQWINVISVHIYTLTAILGGADKLRKACLPLVSERLLPFSDELPPSLSLSLSLSHPHKHTHARTHTHTNRRKTLK